MSLSFEPVGCKLGAARAERVGLDDLGPRFHVCAVDFANEIGRAKVQLVIALVDEDAFRIELRPHRSVYYDYFLRVEQPLKEM